MKSYYIWKQHPGGDNMMDKRCFRSIGIEQNRYVRNTHGVWRPSSPPFGYVVKLTVLRTL